MEFLIFNRNTILGFRVYHGIPEICWYVDNLLNKLKHVDLYWLIITLPTYQVIGIFVSAFWLLKMFFDEPGEGLLLISGYAIVMPCSAPMDPSTSWVLNPS